MVRAAAALLALAPALACASKDGGDPAVSRPRVVIETSAGARHAVDVEIARTEPERRQGLMNRASLPETAGMLFLFDRTSVHTFWMKNTLIPLDIIFIDEEGRIAGIVERAEPRTLTERSVGRPSRYVLEVNGGWARARGVRAGDRVRFENVPRF
ncbi:MAG TPA: DUF192 domain-containing protein [Anaeromyxobacter sp.]|nr:DUF192 domain-containing protein [Anaeromyxobacter sp.]